MSNEYIYLVTETLRTSPVQLSTNVLARLESSILAYLHICKKKRKEIKKKNKIDLTSKIITVRLQEK